MADEVAQICQLEIQGVTLAVKASVTAAQMIMRMLKELFSTVHKVNDWNADKNLHKKGSKTIAEILKLSDPDGPPGCLQVRKDLLEEFEAMLKKNGLHYARAVDFDPKDSLVPIFITPKETTVIGELYQALVKNQMAKDREVLAGHDKNIAETNEKLAGKTTEAARPMYGLSEEQKAEINKLNTQLENYKQARAEAEKWVKYDEEIINCENPTISLMEYLKEARGTEFEFNPEKAMAELDKGVEISPELTMKEFLQPVRDKSCIPETKLTIYSPEIGVTITRAFEVDEETGLAYSRYALKTDKGERYEITDQGMTKQEWNDKVLPELLDKAGVIEGTRGRAFDTEEKFVAYKKYHNRVTPQSEIELIKKVKAGEPVFSSAEAQKEVVHAVSELEKLRTFAEINNTNVKIEVDTNLLTRENGKLVVHLNENDTILFGSSLNGRREGNKSIFEIAKDDEPIFVQKDPLNPKRMSSRKINTEECKKLVDAMSVTEAAAALQKHNRTGGR